MLAAHLPYFGARSQWRHHARDRRRRLQWPRPFSERGHTLVIPKEPAETFDRLSDESAAALGRVLPRICRAVIAATGVSEYNVLENNGPGAHQAVLHVHFHIIPKPNQGEGLGIVWPARALDPKDASVLVKSITGALQKAP